MMDLPRNRFKERLKAGSRQIGFWFTLGSAYVNHLDEDTGTLEVGKLADLVVLDRDIHAPGAGPLGDARVIGTFVEGAAVHDALPA